MGIGRQADTILACPMAPPDKGATRCARNAHDRHRSAAETLPHGTSVIVCGERRYPSPAVTEPTADLARPDDRPMFIIGSPRSGTTLLRMILDSHPRLSCGEETHFLRELEPITGRHWRMLEPYGFPREYWLERVRGLYTGFQADYLVRRGKARWAEKDPTYTLLLPYLGELFPDALYIHLVRDGHDVVASYRDRWGYQSAARVARGEWKRYVSLARALRDGPAASRYHELRYEDLVADPEATLRPLFEFLGEAWDPAVLRFDEQEHDASDRYQRFTAERRAAGGESSAIYRSRVGAGGDKLDPLLRRLLRTTSGALLRDLGYLDRAR